MLILEFCVKKPGLKASAGSERQNKTLLHEEVKEVIALPVFSVRVVGRAALRRAKFPPSASIKGEAALF